MRWPKVLLLFEIYFDRHSNLNLLEIRELLTQMELTQITRATEIDRRLHV
jgi:hypothetical protein